MQSFGTAPDPPGRAVRRSAAGERPRRRPRERPVGGRSSGGRPPDGYPAGGHPAGGHPAGGAAPPGDLIAASPRMRALLRDAARTARFDVPVLIEGETGAGKELLARFLHRESPRRPRALVAVNCGAVPDDLLEAEFFGHARGAFTGAAEARAGLVEAADGGTLFLDEVGELSPRAQALLLRALQEREYRRVGETRVRRSDFRLISATHRALADRVAAGSFRADLFYRLAVARVRIPPLRERRDEFGEIAAALLARLSRRYRIPAPEISPEALFALAARPWPGNIRELESALAAAVLSRPGASRLEPEDFSAAPPPEAAPTGESRPAAAAPAADGRALAEALAAFERLFLLAALRRASGSRAAAARSLGITRQGLWRKLRRHGIR